VSGLLEVVESGVLVSIQDQGRPGYRDIGVPVSGALDPELMAAANALLRNQPGAAVLEVLLKGPTLRTRSGPVRISLAGEITAKLFSSLGHVRTANAWSTATLFPGDSIQIGGVASGIAAYRVPRPPPDVIGLSGSADGWRD